MIFGIFSERFSKLIKLIVHEVSEHAFNSVLAVSLGMLFVWMLPFEITHGSCVCHSHVKSLWVSYKNLPFHILHYSHTFFASITATLTAVRFSRSIWKSVLVGLFVPPVFCTLSDVMFPYWGGKLMGVEMALHLCVVQNIVAVSFLIVLGVIFGLLGSFKTTAANGIRLAASSHFLHDFVSAAASLSYLVSFGYYGWTHNLVYVFLLMLVSVLLPCMMSDFVLPMVFCVSDKALDHDHDTDGHSLGCAYSFHENLLEKEDNNSDGRN